MTTVINSPPASGDSGMGFLVGVLVLVGLVFLFVIFGIPELKRMGSNQLNIPSPQIVVPDKLDVNINQTK